MISTQAQEANMNTHSVLEFIILGTSVLIGVVVFFAVVM
jgi:hypothetical protein